VHREQLRGALASTLATWEKHSGEAKNEESLEMMHRRFKQIQGEPIGSAHPFDRKIHVGLMDYMGESHEEYRRDLDFLETTNTWFDTDSPTRRKVHYLPDECGWQDPSLYEELAARVEDGFGLVLKVSHVATHLCKLERPHEWWPALWEKKYSTVSSGVVAFLWQFPPSFRFQAQTFQRLRELFEYLESSDSWKKLRHIVDFRHGSWYNEEVYSLLKDRRVCLAWLHLQNTGWAADLPNGWTPTIQTTDFTFIRLFGNEDRCTGNYDKKFLQDLYTLCPQDAHSYVLFGNKATKADPEPVVKPCSLNARDFRGLFSTVDLVAHVAGILREGRCPRRLKREEAEVVTRFFLQFSEKGRRQGIRMCMPVSVVASEDGPRCFEWQPEGQAEGLRV